MKIETIEPTAKHFEVVITDKKHSFTYLVETTGIRKTWMVTQIRPIIWSREFKKDEINKHRKEITKNIIDYLLKESK